MGITSNKGKSENWGMGFLLIFFPEDHLPLTTTATSSLSSSSSPFKSTLNPPLRRTSSNQPLLTKTQSAFSVCLLLFLISLLLFTLVPPTPSNHLTPRRHLLSHSQITKLPSSSFALQKMGLLHRRGSNGMHDLVVGHVTESLSPHDLRVFLRLYHFSNFASKSDLVLIFPQYRNDLDNVISEEIESFSHLNSTESVKLSKKEEEPLWGKKSRTGNFTESTHTPSGNSTENELTQSTESTRPSYGSIVSFLAEELDPENSLSGFLDHVAMGMRRWACYPMLLGRVRRNFKHIVLLDLGEVLLLGDPLARVRTRPSESVQLTIDSSITTTRHGKRHVTELVSQKRVNSVMILGGARGVRRLANAMLTEIVRSATLTQRKRKNSLSELAIFNQLAGNEHLLKNANVNVFTESVPDVSSLGRINSVEKVTAVRRGNSNTLEVNAVIRKHICSLVRVNYSSVYSDC